MSYFIKLRLIHSDIILYFWNYNLHLKVVDSSTYRFLIPEYNNLVLAVLLLKFEKQNGYLLLKELRVDGNSYLL